MSVKRQRILDFLSAGKQPDEVAKAVGVHRATVFRVQARFKATGTINRQIGSGRPRSKRTPAIISAVKARIRRNPIRSMRQMAKDFNMDSKSMRNLIKHDIGARSLARIPRPLQTLVNKEKRLQRCKRILSFLKNGPHILLFSDEKIFSVDRASNRRNDRYIAKGNTQQVPDYIKHTFKTKHPSQVMVFALVASDGKKMPLCFIEKGEKVNSNAYIQILENDVKPWIDSNYRPEDSVVFTQDGAPCHTAKKTQDWLKKNVQNFWPKDMWPPNSPDINPLDYSIWANLQSNACSKPHANIEVLKASLVKAWNQMSGKSIVTTCKRFRSRIEKIIQNNGGLID